MLKSNIRSERIRMQMSQSDLAYALNVNQNSISNWETGSSTPSANNLVRMVELFGCSSDYLLGLTDERLPPHRVYVGA